MHLYKHFWKMVIKNKVGIIIYSIITAVMIIIASVIAESERDISESEGGIVDISESLTISYVDKDNSELSKAFIEYLSKNNTMVDYGDKTDEEINDLLYFEIVLFNIEIPEGFQNSIDNGTNDLSIAYKTGVSQAAYTYKIENIIDSYFGVYTMFANSGLTEEEAIQKTNEAMDQELNISIYSDKEDYLGRNVKEYVVYFIATYITYLSFGMIALSVGRSIVVTNNEKVATRISAGPVSETKRIFVNQLGLYSFAVLLFVIFTIAMYVYAGETHFIRERGYLILINVLLCLLYNGSITSIFASLNIKDNILSMVVNIVGLSMSFMCGVFVPQWMLGEGVLNIAKLMPFYWTVKSLNYIYPEAGSGLAFDMNAVLETFGIQALFVIVFALVAMLIRKMKKN